MFGKLRQAGLVWPTLLALAGLAVLVGLGTWQLERRRWKEDLLAKIAARVHADPVALARAEEIASKGEDVEYLHVFARGRFHHDKEQYYYAPAPAGLGWHVYTPLELASQRVVWINRGFVPDARKNPQTRPQGQLPGEVEARGLVRLPAGKGLFTPPNDVQRNLWYWPDLAAMTAAAFPGSPQSVEALSLVIEADAQPEPPGGLPRGGVTRLQLPNRHLEYAITWYGLALTLIGVYLTFAINRLRASTGT